MRRTIGILDYGVGNCGSVEGLSSRIGYKTKILQVEKDFSGIDILVLPGVGALPPVMGIINQRGLAEAIFKFYKRGAPIIGICLGMQLFANSSEEYGHTDALGLIPGHVVPIPNDVCHIGWNSLVYRDSHFSNIIMKSLSNHEDFYFNHGYMFKAQSDSVVLASSSNMGVEIPSIIVKDNIVGLQFHPEISQLAGEILMRSVINILSSDGLEVEDYCRA